MAADDVERAGRGAVPLQDRGQDLPVDEHDRQRAGPRRLDHHGVAGEQGHHPERGVGAGRVLRRVDADHAVRLAQQLQLPAVGGEGLPQLRLVPPHGGLVAAAQDAADLPLGQPARVALGDEDVDQLGLPGRQRLVELEDHPAADRLRQQPELPARPPGRPQGPLVVVRAAHRDPADHVLGRLDRAAQLERPLEVEGGPVVPNEGRRADHVRPADALDVLAVDVGQVGPHTGSASMLGAAKSSTSTSRSWPVL